MKNSIILATLLVLISQVTYAKTTMAKLTSEKSYQKVLSSMPKNDIGVGSRRHAVGIALGQTSLLGDFYDNGNNGMGFDVVYDYKASHFFSVYADFHYSSHQKGKNRIALPSLALGIKKALYRFDSIAPFVMGGLGFYWPKTYENYQIENKETKSSTETVFGLNLGLGVDLNLNSKYSFSILGHYHNPFDISQDDKKDIEGSYINVLMGLSYLF